MRLLGIIPARGGSQRIPGKNLALLGGRPLLVYTCAAARAAGVCTRLYVNTDCPRIAATARSAGVACPSLRPAALAAADTPTRAAMLWMLDLLAERGEHYDALLILQPTSPLRTAADIAAAWALYSVRAPQPVASVSPVAPGNWLGRLSGHGEFQRMDGADLIYRLNGAIYIYDLARYRANDYATAPHAYVMPAWRGLDIDTPEDLRLAEALLAAQPQQDLSGPAGRNLLRSNSHDSLCSDARA